MIATRLRQISLLLIAMAISALAFIQMFQRTAGEFLCNTPACWHWP